MAADPDRAIARYREHVANYDASCKRTQPLRRETVAKLRLQPGDTVLDVGSGTGMSFELLVPRVGEAGRVIGVELSPDMMRLARDKVRTHDWGTVELIESSVEQADIVGPIDAVLCFYTHDVLRSEAALTAIFSRARSGARVAVAGMKLFPWYLAPLNVYALAKAHPYMTTFQGLAAPWRVLERWVPDLAWRPTQLGMGYIAWGTVA